MCMCVLLYVLVRVTVVSLRVYVCYCVWWLCVHASVSVYMHVAVPLSFWLPNLIFCSRCPSKWGSLQLPVGQWLSGWCGLTLLSGDKGSRSLGAWAQCQPDSSSAGELEAQKSREEVLG